MLKTELEANRQWLLPDISQLTKRDTSFQNVQHTNSYSSEEETDGDISNHLPEALWALWDRLVQKVARCFKFDL